MVAIHLPHDPGTVCPDTTIVGPDTIGADRSGRNAVPMHAGTGAFIGTAASSDGGSQHPGPSPPLAGSSS